jgi:hypothetical protein
VNLPAYDTGDLAAPASVASRHVIPVGGEEGGTSRLDLRLPDGRQARIEEAARREGLSLDVSSALAPTTYYHRTPLATAH